MPGSPRIVLPARAGQQPAVECAEHGRMPWLELAWRCAGPGCGSVVTEADLARLARWLGGESGYGSPLAVFHAA